MTEVSRTEIADCVENAFGKSPVSSAELLEFAISHGARDEVLEVLGRLRGDTYRNLRNLWSELADVPVER